MPRKVPGEHLLHSTHSLSIDEAFCRHDDAYVVQGRGYRRLVSLTREPRILVNEFDRRVEEEELTDDEQGEVQSRYIDIASLLAYVASTSSSDTHRADIVLYRHELEADRDYRAYKALQMHIPEVPRRLGHPDVTPSDIRAMFKTVRPVIAPCLCPNTDRCSLQVPEIKHDPTTLHPSSSGSSSG